MRPWIVRSLLAIALVGCSESLEPDDVAGTYRLITVSGQSIPTSHEVAILGGEVELSTTGEAMIRIRRMNHAGPGVVEEVRLGTFVVRKGSLMLTEIAQVSPPRRVRHVVRMQGDELTFRYTSPGDGPDIIHVFRRE